VFDDVARCVRDSSALTIRFGDAEVKDVKFADDESMMVILRTKGTVPAADMKHRPLLT